MPRPVTSLCCYFTILAVILNATKAIPQDVTPQSVQAAIDRGVQYLLQAQHDDGGWPQYAGQEGGVTALVVLALLNAGLAPDDERITRGLEYARRFPPRQTYTVALQTMAYCTANPAKYATDIQRNTEWLIKNQNPRGGWSYGEVSGVADDPSNSQFALLALHEAQRAGVQLPKEDWQRAFMRARDYWRELQNKDGSFPYDRDRRGSMTCAGIASLVIVGSQPGDAEAMADPAISCCGNVQSHNAAISAALKWLGNEFRVDANPHHPTAFQFYYLYGLERAGRMTGQRFIGGHDWYREGCRELLRLQDKFTGQFRSSFGGIGNAESEQSLALLFLAKGKRQIVVSRLQTGNDDDWNHHSSAMQHLTSHTEQVWKRELAWQSIDLSRASVEDLLESPVIFLSGTAAPPMTNAHKRLLREYVEQGGFIFAEACNGDGCNGAEFDQFIRQFAAEVLGRPLEKLPLEHPIWYAESRVDLKSLPDDFWLYGVQTCCRLGMVYSPISLSCRWELNIPYGLRPDYSAKVQQELDAATLLGVNVLSYATGKELKQKLQSVLVLEEVRNIAPTERGVFILPQLQHNAGADDAPRAISNLVEWMGKENPFRMSSEHRLIPIRKESLERYPMVFMHGRGELRLQQPEREALREYLQNGGFLFADAICADEQFTKSFRRELEAIIGQPLRTLPAGHEMLTTQYFGYDVRQVSIIDAVQGEQEMEVAKRKISPQLEVASIEDRIAVVFSPLDLSCALESRHSMQCRGYFREDAARLGINIILFGMQQ